MDQQPTKPLRSEYADDPDMAELVELFVSELPNRVEAIESAANASDAETLKRLAHQLKGAAPGYGYPTIGHAAANVEDPLKDAAQPEQTIAQITRQIDELVETCRSAIV